MFCHSDFYDKRKSNRYADKVAAVSQIAPLIPTFHSKMPIFAASKI